jgi:hypothetical protein
VASLGVRVELGNFLVPDLGLFVVTFGWHAPNIVSGEEWAAACEI